MLSKIKPPLVLMLICAIICGLLIAAYEATYVDTTGVITDSLKKGLAEIYGDDGTEYYMLKNDDGTVMVYDGITSIIKSEDNRVAFEITADGYAKGGIHALIGVGEDGTVTGISIITISETQGLGTKIAQPDYLAKYQGASAADDTIDNITGATYSSKGLKSAVNAALDAYNQHKEEIFDAK